MAAIRRGLAAARKDSQTVYLFLTGYYPMELLNDFLSLEDHFPTPLEGAAWKRAVCREMRRLSSLMSATGTMPIVRNCTTR